MLATSFNTKTELQAQDLLAQVERHDGVAAFSEAYLRGLTEKNPEYTYVLALQDADTLAGILSIHEDVAEMAVLPDDRRNGYATDMIDHVLKDRPSIDVWAHGNLESAQGLARSFDAQVVRDLWKMSWSYEAQDYTPAIESAFGEMLILNYEDACAQFGKNRVEQQWLTVNNDAFSWHPEQGNWSLATLQHQMDTQWFDPRDVLFVFDDSHGQDTPTLVGFHWVKVEPDEPGEGEIYVLGLNPAYTGHGLGTPLTMLGLMHLVEKGIEHVDLYVEGDNPAAVKTYEKLGFLKTHSDVVYRLVRADESSGENK